MIKKVILLSIILTISSFQSIYACGTDADCLEGGVCIQTVYDFQGFCYGENRTDESLQDRETGNPGDLCGWDSDCGDNGRCLIPLGELYGTCL